MKMLFGRIFTQLTKKDSFSLRDDSRDGGGRTKFGTRVEKAGMRESKKPVFTTWAEH